MADPAPSSASDAKAASRPRRFHVAAITPFSRNALIVAGALVLLLAVAPLFRLDATIDLVMVSIELGFGRPEMRLVIQFCTLLALAQMWNLLAGYAGLVSVGQQGYVGLGAYMFFIFAAFRDANPILSIVIAGVIAGLIAIPTAGVVFRLTGAYFAIGAWVVAEVFRLVFAQITVFGGGTGRSLPAAVVRSLGGSPYDRDMVIYWLALGLAAGSIGFVYAVLRSRFGLALAAIRDSEPAAASLGVDTRTAKHVVYIAAAVVTGMCGAVITLSTNTISPAASFSVIEWTAYVIFIVVIGGVGRIEGPIVGTIVFFLLRDLVAPWIRETVYDSATVHLILLGALAVVVMLFAPRGLWGLVAERFGVEVFPIQRRLVTHDDRSS